MSFKFTFALIVFALTTAAACDGDAPADGRNPDQACIDAGHKPEECNQAKPNPDVNIP